MSSHLDSLLGSTAVLDSRNTSRRAQTKGIPAGFISEEEMARKLEKHVGSLRRWGTIGYGPKRFKIGKTVCYREDGVIRWLEGIEQEHPKERPAPRRRGRPGLTETAVSA